MKLHHVDIGAEYETKVGDAWTRVKVVRETVTTQRGLRHVGTQTRRTFVVARVDTGAVLPKPRTPAALRPLAGTCVLCHASVVYPDGVHLKSGRQVHAVCLRAYRQAYQARIAAAREDT